VARGAELTIVYEPAEKRWLTATIPALPGTIRAGKTQHEARENVLGALAEIPSVQFEQAPAARSERVRLDLSLSRSVECDFGREG
jgi:predicted RNase H-like HicB family nuclease